MSNEATNLPALIDRARDRLATARTSAEVLESRAMAQAAMHYARITSAANETHADCLRMIVRAEMRMADEIDAGQKRGEIATSGKRKSCNVSTVTTVPEALGGVHRTELQRWRKTRDAGIAVVEDAIGEALSENRAPTKADVHRAVDRSRDPLDVPAEPATTPDDSLGESTTLYHLKRYWRMASKKDQRAFRSWINESH